MKKIIPSAIITLLLFFALSCSSDNVLSTGGISIKIGESISRAIEPTISLDVTKYVIQGEGPGDTSFRTETDISGDTVTRENLLPGTWSLKAIAYNSSDKAIGEGNTSVTVTAGKTTDARITVTEYEGTGTITIVLSQASADYSAVISKVHDGILSEYKREPLTRNEDGILVASFSLPRGFYTINLVGGNEGVQLPTPEAFRIVRDDNLSVSYMIRDTGGINTIISNGIKPSPCMNLILSSDTVAAGSELTAEAVMSAGNFSFVWYVDGVMRPETAASITVIPDNTGTYTVSCLAIDTDTGVIWSEKSTFTVLAAQDEILAPSFIDIALPPSTQSRSVQVDQSNIMQMFKSVYFTGSVPAISTFEKRKANSGDIISDISLIGINMPVSYEKSKGHHIFSGTSENDDLKIFTEFNPNTKSFDYVQSILINFDIPNSSRDRINIVAGKDITIDKNGCLHGPLKLYFANKTSSAADLGVGLGEFFSDENISAILMMKPVNFSGLRTDDFASKLNSLSISLSNESEFIKLGDSIYEANAPEVTEPLGILYFNKQSEEIAFFGIDDYGNPTGSYSIEEFQAFADTISNNSWKFLSY